MSDHTAATPCTVHVPLLYFHVGMAAASQCNGSAPSGAWGSSGSACSTNQEAKPFVMLYIQN